VPPPSSPPPLQHFQGGELHELPFALPARVVVRRRRERVAYFRVRAVNAHGAGAWSSALAVGSVSDMLPCSPEDVSVLPSDLDPQGLALLGWSLDVACFNKPQHTNVLELTATPPPSPSPDRRQLASSEDALESATFDLTSTVPDCLEACEAWVGEAATAFVRPATWYQVRLWARSVFGSSIPSDPIFVLTPPDVPEPPISPTATAVTASMISIEWGVPCDNGEPLLRYTVRVCDAQQVAPSGCTEYSAVGMLQ
jgi:hypothetical protein